MAQRLQTVFGHILGANNTDCVLSPTSGNVAQSQYGYTVDLANQKLTPEQRQFYEENGFLVIKNLVPKEDLEKYRKRFEQICRGEVRVPGITIMRDVAIAKTEYVADQKAITKLQTWHDDEVLWQYCCTPKIVDYLESFLGPSVMAMHTMLINKPPDPGKLSSRHPMHQDLYYFPFRPADRIVCAWTAMERVNRDNGCLVVVPGTHKGELLQHEYPQWEGGVNKLYHGVRDYNPDQPRVHVEMEAGDTVFFHPILIHGSGANRTNGFRKAISCHYSTGDMHFIDLKDTVQSVIEKEVLELAERKTGIPVGDLKYEDIWKFRCRPVKGEPSFNSVYA